MNICLITPGFAGGGAEVIAVNTANFYHDEGYKVLLISFGYDGPVLKSLSSDVEILFVTPKNYLSLFHALKSNRQTFDHTICFIRHTSINAYIARLFGRLRTQRMHFIEVNTFYQQKNLTVFSRLLQNFLLKIAYNSVDDLIAVSNLVKQEIQKKYDVKNIRVVGNPCIEDVDLTFIPKVNSHVADGLRYVAAGRLHFQKDYKTMVTGFSKYLINYKRYQDTLTIFGEGPNFRELNLLINDLDMNDNIFLCGYVDDLSVRLTEFDVFLMTSRYEGFGNVLVLAMAAGLPIIARRNTGGPDDLVNDQTGLLFDDEPSLVKILGEFSLESYDQVTIKSNALNYTIKEICLKYLNS